MAIKGSTRASTVSVALQFHADNASLSKAAKQTAGQLTQLQKRTALAANKMSSFIPAFAAIGGAAFAAFNVAIRGAVGFQDSFAGVKKTLDFSGQAARQTERNFKVLAKSIVDISTQAPVAANDLNKIAEIGGQLGVEAVNITKFTETIAKLTVATNLSAEDGAFALSRLSAITRTPERQIENLASVVVRLGNEFAATESEIVNAAQKIAAAMELLESPTSNAAADSLALAAALKQVGQQTQAGSTAVARALDTMSTAVLQGGRELSIFAQVSQMTTDEFSRLAELSPADAFVAFLEGLGKVGIAGGDTVSLLEELGLAQQRTLRALRSMALAADDVKDALNSANEEFVLNNALQTEAEKRYETVTSQVTLLRNQIQAIAIDVGNDALPAVNNFIQSLQTIGAGTTIAGLTAMAKTISAITLALFAMRTAARTAGETLDEFQKQGIPGTGVDGRVQVGLAGLGGNVGKSFRQRKAETSGFLRDNTGIGARGGGEGAFLASAARGGARVEGLSNILNEARVILGESIFDDVEKNKSILAKAREDDGTFNEKKLDTEAEKERFRILQAIDVELIEQLGTQERIAKNKADQLELEKLILQAKELQNEEDKINATKSKSSKIVQADKEETAVLKDEFLKFADDEIGRTGANFETKLVGEDGFGIDNQTLTSFERIFEDLGKIEGDISGADIASEIDDEHANITQYAKDTEKSFMKIATISEKLESKNLEFDDKFQDIITKAETQGFAKPGQFQGAEGLRAMVQGFEKDPDSSLNMASQINKMKRSGMDESAIAKDLKISNEELKRHLELGRQQKKLLSDYNTLLKSLDSEGNFKELTNDLKNARTEHQHNIDALKHIKNELNGLDDVSKEVYSDMVMDVDKLIAHIDGLILATEEFGNVDKVVSDEKKARLNEIRNELIKNADAQNKLTGETVEDNNAAKIQNRLYQQSTKELLKLNKAKIEALMIEKRKKGKLNKDQTEELGTLQSERKELLQERDFEKTGRTNKATQAFKELFRGFMFGDQIAKLLSSSLDFLTKILDKLIAKLSTLFEALSKLFGPLAEFLKWIGKSAIELGTKFFKAIPKVAEAIGKFLLEKIQQFTSFISTKFINGMDKALEGIIRFGEVLRGKFTAGVEKAKIGLIKFMKMLINSKAFEKFLTQLFLMQARLKIFRSLLQNVGLRLKNFKLRIQNAFLEFKAAQIELFTFIKFFKSHFLMNLREGIAVIRSAFNRLKSSIMESMPIEMIRMFVTRMADAFVGLGELIMSLPAKLKTGFNQLVSLLSKLGVAFKNSLPGFLIIETAKRFGIAMFEMGKMALDFGKKLAIGLKNSKAFKMLDSGVRKTALMFKNLAITIGAFVSSTLMSLGQGLKKLAMGAFAGFNKGLDALTEKFKKFLSDTGAQAKDIAKNSQVYDKAAVKLKIMGGSAANAGKNAMKSMERFARLHKGLQALLNVIGGVTGALLRKRKTLISINAALQKSIAFSKGFKLASAGLTAVINGLKAAVMGLVTMFGSMILMTAVFGFFFKLQEEAKKTAAAIKEISNEINALNEVTKDLDFQEIRLQELQKALDKELAKAKPNTEIIKVIEDEIDNITRAYAMKSEEVREAEQELGKTLLFDTTAQGQNVEKRFEAIFKSMGFDAVQSKNFTKVIQQELGAMLNDFDFDSADDIAIQLFSALDESFGTQANNFGAGQLQLMQELAKQQGMSLEAYIDQFDTLVDFGMLDSMIGTIFTDSAGGFIKSLEKGNFDFGGLSAEEFLKQSGISNFTQELFNATNVEFEDAGNGMIRVFQEVEEYVMGSGVITRTKELGLIPEALLGTNPTQGLTDFIENMVFLDTVFSQMRGKGGNPIIADNRQVGNQAKMSTFMQMQNEALIERFEFLRMNNAISQDLNAHTMNREQLIKTVMMAENQLHEQQLEEAKKQLEGLGLLEFEMTKFEKALNETLAKSASNAVTIFSDLPKRMRKSVRAMLEELTIKSFQLSKFDKDVRRLASIAPMLAKDIASQGLAAQSILQDFLRDPAAIATAEGLLQRMRPKDAADMGLTTEEQAKAQAQGLALGNATSEGILIGIQERQAQIGAALVSGMENAIEESKAFLDVVNPSMLVAREIGKPMAEGAAYGVEDNHGFLEKAMIDMAQSGIDAADDKFSEMEDFISERGYFDGGEYYKQFAEGIRANGDTVVQAVAEEIQEVSQFVTYGFSQATQDIAEALNMMFAVTGGLRDITSANYAVQKAEQSLMATRRKNATLSERIIKNQIALQEAELKGRKNNITMTEEAGLLQKKIALDEMKRKQKGQFSASERKRIVEAEEELERVRLAAEAGIATSLDVEVAEEKLAELKGTNKSLDEQKLAILEVSIAEEELNDAREKAREVDPELIALREEQIALLDEQANASFELQTAYDGLEAATENVYTTELKYEEARQAFIDFAESSPAAFQALVDAYGGVGGSIDTVITKTINLANNTETSMDKAIKSVQTYITELERAQHVESLSHALGSTTRADYSTDPDIRSELNTRKSIGGLFGDTGIEDTALSSIQSDILNPGFSSFGDDTSTAANRDVFESSEDYLRSQTALKNLRKGKGSRRDLANAFQYLYGIQTSIDNTGQVVINSAQLQAAMNDKNNPLSKLGVDYKTLVQQISEAQGITVADMSSSVQREGVDLARTQDGERLDYRYDSARVPYAQMYDPQNIGHVARLINMSGGTTTSDNQTAEVLLGAGKTALDYHSAVAKGQKDMLRRLLVERLDKAHEKGEFDKFSVVLKRKYGGMVAPFRRALVGEYGPEMVTSLPQGGLRVTPQGSERSGSISVENLNVNVTGVPTDPIQARKAAVQIQGALRRLEKEGNAGSGLSRR